MRFDGAVAVVLDKLVDMGYFRTRSEAIRMGVLELGREYGMLNTPQEIEDELAAMKMQRLDEETKAGKRKLLSEKDVLRKYPHLKNTKG